MKIKDLSTTNHLPIEGLTIIFFKTLYVWGRALWPILIIYIFKTSKYQAYKEYIYIGLVAILFLSIIHAILSYKHFLFHIKDGEFIVNKGYINKEKKSIPLERIQTVNIKQNILQQIIGVVQLEIDTAGSKKKELSLPALRKEHAKKIESILLSKKTINDISIEKNENNEIINTEEEEEDIINKKHKSIFSLTILELAKIAISDNILKGGLLALSFTYGIYQQYSEIINDRFSNELDSMKETANTAGWKMILAIAGVFIIFSIIISIIRIILINFELSLSQIAQGYKLEKGLFNKKSVIIPLIKIQTYTWTTNPLRKFFNIVTVTIRQASSNNVDENSAVHIPGCKSLIEETIRKEIFNNSDIQEYLTFKTQAYYFLRTWAFLVIIPSIVTPYLIGIQTALMGILAWNLFISIMLYKASKKRLYSISKDYILIQKGAISTSNKLVPLFKIQAVRFKQSLFMKRKGRANLTIYTASESISIPFISEKIARESYNYILYIIENNNRKWM